MGVRRVTVAVALVLLVTACSDDDGAVTTTAPPIVATTSTTQAAPTTTAPPETTTTTTPPTPLDELAVDVIEVASGFDQPTFVEAREGDDRLFVVDQPGRIHAVDSGGEVTVVLDISARVGFGDERGLLGLAFHPGDPSRMFVHYSRASDGAGVIDEHRFPLGAGGADPEATRTILVVPQPAGNHNGGMLAFGPDGMLYAAFGDGGGVGDTYRQGQNPSTLLGAILRLDVDSGDPYAIPPDNPFAGGEQGAPEVWAYGLRNPWRFSFDGDDLWIADVGQADWEEVNLVSVGDGGANFGWPVLEGTDCFAGPADLCADNDFVHPVHEYTIRGVGRCAVAGGYVYRGSASPGLAGAYVFGDYCSGEIMALRVDGGVVAEHRVFPSIGERITSFGTDLAGELYVVTVRALYRVVATG
jgi:glucose/arabinose dehydrogenase